MSTIMDNVVMNILWISFHLFTWIRISLQYILNWRMLCHRYEVWHCQTVTIFKVVLPVPILDGRAAWDRFATTCERNSWQNPNQCNLHDADIDEKCFSLTFILLFLMYKRMRKFPALFLSSPMHTHIIFLLILCWVMKQLKILEMR